MLRAIHDAHAPVPDQGHKAIACKLVTDARNPAHIAHGEGFYQPPVSITRKLLVRTCACAGPPYDDVDLSSLIAFPAQSGGTVSQRIAARRWLPPLDGDYGLTLLRINAGGFYRVHHRSVLSSAGRNGTRLLRCFYVPKLRPARAVS